jgi:hypothetical protein
LVILQSRQDRKILWEYRPDESKKRRAEPLMTRVGSVDFRLASHIFAVKLPPERIEGVCHYGTAHLPGKVDEKMKIMKGQQPV